MTLSQLLFWISIFYAVYIIALYPLVLAWLARVRPKPVRRAPYTPSISVILAVHNGEQFLRSKLESIHALDYPQELIQIVIINDASTDRTREIAESYGSRIELINTEKGGKSAALNLGNQVATGDVLMLTDVRQRLASDSLRLLLENLADPGVAAVSAELQIETGSSNAEADIGVYWKYERWIRLNLSAVDSIFGATGAYYLLRRALAVKVPPNTLVDDMYLPLSAFLKGYRLIVDRRARMYDFPTNLQAEFGRKVRTLAGNYQILGYHPRLLTFQNRLLVHYLSYKVGRLLLPFALIVAAVSSLWAGGWLTRMSLYGQGLVYLATLTDPVIPPGNVFKRVTSPIRTFLVMMLATACAISIWFVPRSGSGEQRRCRVRSQRPDT